MSELLTICEQIVNKAKDDEQIEVVAVYGKETEVRAYEGEIESLTTAESQGVGIRVVKDGRQGFAHAGTFTPEDLIETLNEARDNLVFATPDEFCGVAEPDGIKPVNLDVYNDELAGVPTEEKVAMALELERRTRVGDSRIIGVESADYSDSISESAVMTSTGISAASRETGCSLTAYSLAEENNETQTGFGFSIGRCLQDLDIEKASTDAVNRATRMLGSVKPPSGRFTVVLDPWVSAQFLGIVGGTLNAESVQKGRSLFAGRLGEEVADSSLNLIDDPTDPAAFTATSTDGEGLATRRNVLIENGRLNQFVHNSYTARKEGVSSTGSAIRGYASTPGVGVQALAVTPGNTSPESLISQVTDGVLVQGVSGLHSGVNPVSGDFSTGAEGLRIRNGELAEPVREFTIASTIQKMLSGVNGIGNDLQWLPMRSAGVTLVIGELTVSGA
ncbi:MAG: Metalloprotease PmbA [Acidimicrobiales bacterium AG-410-I20]|nr:MAG: Metalloprotease PmbA [Acidimicrobiales bacterium AG-410-I20]